MSFRQIQVTSRKEFIRLIHNDPAYNKGLQNATVSLAWDIRCISNCYICFSFLTILSLTVRPKMLLREFEKYFVLSEL